MIHSALILLIALVIVGAILWCVRAICAALSIPEPIPVLAMVAVVLAFLFWLAQFFGVA